MQVLPHVAAFLISQALEPGLQTSGYVSLANQEPDTWRLTRGSAVVKEMSLLTKASKR